MRKSAFLRDSPQNVSQEKNPSDLFFGLDDFETNYPLPWFPASAGKDGPKVDEEKGK